MRTVRKIGKWKLRSPSFLPLRNQLGVSFLLAKLSQQNTHRIHAFIMMTLDDKAIQMAMMGAGWMRGLTWEESAKAVSLTFCGCDGFLFMYMTLCPSWTPVRAQLVRKNRRDRLPTANLHVRPVTVRARRSATQP